MYGDSILRCTFWHGYAKAVIELNEGILWPQTLPDFLASDDLSGPLQKHDEQSIGRGLDFQAGAIPRERLLSGVQFERAEAGIEARLEPLWHALPQV